MGSELFIEEEKQDKEHRTSRRASNSQERFDEEVKSFSTDDTKMAREIISLKKEVNRLHFKVKSYQEKNRSFQIISTVIITLLLLAITYRVYVGN